MGNEHREISSTLWSQTHWDCSGQGAFPARHLCEHPSGNVFEFYSIGLQWVSANNFQRRYFEWCALLPNADILTLPQSHADISEVTVSCAIKHQGGCKDKHLYSHLSLFSFPKHGTSEWKSRNNTQSRQSQKASIFLTRTRPRLEAYIATGGRIKEKRKSALKVTLQLWLTV